MHQAPNQTEPIVAWKSWKITHSYDHLRLVNDGEQLWHPQQGHSELCPHSRPQRALCKCGIESFKNKHSLKKERCHYDAVIGQVSVWGEVQECEKGYRSQWAYPLELWVRGDLGPEIRTELERAYGVQVHLRPRFSPLDRVIVLLRQEDIGALYAFTLFIALLSSYSLNDLFQNRTLVAALALILTLPLAAAMAINKPWRKRLPTVWPSFVFAHMVIMIFGQQIIAVAWYVASKNSLFV